MLDVLGNALELMVWVVAVFALAGAWRYLEHRILKKDELEALRQQGQSKVAEQQFQKNRKREMREESDDDTGENRSLFNPATGLPMMGAFDTEGNHYGFADSSADGLGGMHDDGIGPGGGPGIDDSFDIDDGISGGI